VGYGEVGGRSLRVALRLGKGGQIQLGAGVFEAGLHGGKGLEGLREVRGRLWEGATRLSDAAQGGVRPVDRILGLGEALVTGR
jgi:hypothetical protein